MKPLAMALFNACSAAEYDEQEWVRALAEAFDSVYENGFTAGQRVAEARKDGK
jgi:hypothetical protein